MIRAILMTHPRARGADVGVLVRCVEECFECAAACTSCADACLAEDDLQELVACIRLNLDCADVCEATGCVALRQTAGEVSVLRALVESCVIACRACAEECEKHAEHHEHCRVCAAACRGCLQACQDLLATTR